MKTAIMVAVIVLADSAGDVLLTRGMKQVGEISTMRLGELISISRRVIVNRNFLSAVFYGHHLLFLFDCPFLG